MSNLPPSDTESAIASSEFETTEILAPSSVNPWLSIWFHPGQTIRVVVAQQRQFNNQWQNVLLLGALAGISTMFDSAIDKAAGERYGTPLILMVCLVMGSILGLIVLYLSSFFVKWIGQLLGGTAKATDIQLALAWASIPTVVSLPFVLLPVVLGIPILTNAEPETMSEGLIVLVAGIVSFVLGIWTLVLNTLCLAEVQRFSALKAFINLTLAGIALAFAFLLLIVLPYGVFMSAVKG